MQYIDIATELFISKNQVYLEDIDLAEEQQGEELDDVEQEDSNSLWFF